MTLILFVAVIKMFMRAEKKIFWQKKENGQIYDCHFYLTSEWCCANNEIGKEFRISYYG